MFLGVLLAEEGPEADLGILLEVELLAAREKEGVLCDALPTWNHTHVLLCEHSFNQMASSLGKNMGKNRRKGWWCDGVPRIAARRN
jgi:hypothetical protein